jgi:hypothetical protein
MVKERIPCPLALASGFLCADDCPVCHGCGAVREWTLVLEVEWVPPDLVSDLKRFDEAPTGMTIDRVDEGHSYHTIVARVRRFKLSEAMAVACEFFVDARGQAPIVRKAW